ncbi:ATP-dependent DNA ligase [Streptomyces sp. NPDC002225]|uniref:ATP-dependent DNA ligase n=1 Tax=Streptomyces sp. NPDC002225 TaxID=3154413 RepID=UPI003318012C
MGGEVAPQQVRHRRRRRLGNGRADLLAQVQPAFDLLQADGQELLHVPYGERRARLEQLFTDRGLSAPWTLCPETSDVATAQEWLTSWTQVPGIEGLVVRGSGERYLPGARALYKVRRRDTTEAVIGAVTGTVRRPRTLVLGRLDVEGVLRPVARSTPLRPDTAQVLAERLAPAGPGHPWTDVTFTTSWGSRTPLDVVLVDPELVAETTADTAQERGAWRHPVRFARLRLDAAVPDVPPFGAGAEPAAG